MRAAGPYTTQLPIHCSLVSKFHRKRANRKRGRVSDLNYSNVRSLNSSSSGYIVSQNSSFPAFFQPFFSERSYNSSFQSYPKQFLSELSLNSSFQSENSTLYFTVLSTVLFRAILHHTTVFLRSKIQLHFIFFCAQPSKSFKQFYSPLSCVILIYPTFVFLPVNHLLQLSIIRDNAGQR